MQKLSTWLLKTAGWKLNLPLPVPPKSVVCVAPHTSNWDFIIGKLSYWSLRRESSFLMKKSWFFFPLGNILRAIGGVPVDRSRNTSVTRQMGKIFKERESFHIAITPEGTRSPNKRWKMGFYHIAVEAGVPIELAYLDYDNKVMGITEIIYPSGDQKADMEKIVAYYKKNSRARFPENFILPQA